MEFMKKIMVFTSIIFAIVILVCGGIFVYSTFTGISYDWTGIVALLTVSGTAFTTAVAVYAAKAKLENVYKIKKSFLQEKYDILHNMGVLTKDYAVEEILSELSNIDGKLDSVEENVDTENDTTINLNL